MRTVAEIKQDIPDLPEADYAKIVDWLYKLEEAVWNRWIRPAGNLEFSNSNPRKPREVARYSNLRRTFAH